MEKWWLNTEKYIEIYMKYIKEIQKNKGTVVEKFSILINTVYKVTIENIKVQNFTFYRIFSG